MRKTKLLIGALSFASILSLSSCGFEKTDARDFEGTLEMYKAFFKRTYEYDNMRVVLDLGNEGFRTEYICASASHTIDSSEDMDTWAFVNKDGWKTVACEYGLETPDGKNHWYMYDTDEYQKEYKSFVSYINYLDKIEETLKEPSSEVAEGYKKVLFKAKKEDLGDEKARFSAEMWVDDENRKDRIVFIAESERCLVSKVDYSFFNASGELSRHVSATFSYGGVKPIDIPDITGWPQR